MYAIARWPGILLDCWTICRTLSRVTSELSSSHSRWLELADIALALDAAREEQEKIKQTIRPSVEKYKRMRDCSK